jgi:hypothetical protein
MEFDPNLCYRKQRSRAVSVIEVMTDEVRINLKGFGREALVA